MTRIFIDRKTVTFHANNLPLEEFLRQVLTPLSIDFVIENKTIFVRAKTPAASLSPRLNLNAPPITGVVRGPDGKPLAGINVVVKNSNKGVVTDVNGQFSIDAEPGISLLISSIGYNSQEIKIPETQTHLDISMAIATSPLDEVQIIAYGTTSQRLSTGNVSTVKGEDIGKQPVSNPLAALAGRIPGMLITQSTGVPGGGFFVQIRGRNSIGNGNDPFYIIDGVPYTAELLPNLAGNILRPNVNNPQSGGNPLNFISPSEIESISVLKDADATAIYGSRGANGVVIITTKKGGIGKSQVNLNLRSGVGKVDKKLDLLNTSQYLEARRKLLEMMDDRFPIQVVPLTPQIMI